MCGRYSADLKWEDVAKLYDLSKQEPMPQWNFQPSYNVCPTKDSLSPKWAPTRGELEARSVDRLRHGGGHPPRHATGGARKRSGGGAGASQRSEGRAISLLRSDTRTIGIRG